MNWTLTWNSLCVSSLATLLAAAGGLGMALWLTGLSARVRKPVLVLTGLAALMPAFFATSCWLHWLGTAGTWQRWLPVNLYSLPGAAGILALLHWPFTALACWAAWQRLDPILLEAEPRLTGWLLVSRLLWPLSRPTLLPVMLFTWVLCLNNFAVPSILQVKVLPAELWVQFNTTFNYATALRLGWPLVLAPAALLLLLRRATFSLPHWTGALPPGLFRQRLGRAGQMGAGLAGAGLLVFSVFLPLAEGLTVGGSGGQLAAAWATGRAAWLNSLVFAALAASAGTLVAGAGWRWPLGWLWWLLFLTPGVALGMGLIHLLNRPPWLFFYQSSAVVVGAWTLRYLAPLWSGIGQALRTADPDLADAARMDGASAWQAWWRVQWPQLRPVAASFWYVAFLLCLWDVETLILVVPPGGETLALRIFNLLHYGYNQQVNALCVLLFLAALAPLAAWQIAHWSRAWLRAARPAAGLGLAALILAVAAGCSKPASALEAPLSSRFFSKTVVIGSRGTAPGQFNKPRSVAVDRADNLYVVDMTGRVQKFDAHGVFQAVWEMEQTDKGKPKGMAADAAGNILVLEPHYARLNAFAPDGSLAFRWGPGGTNQGELAFPRSVGVNSRGDLFISEYMLVERVQQFAAGDRHWLKTIGRAGSGPGEFNRAEGLGLDRADRLYVADSCNHRIQVFGADGRFARAYGQPGAGPGQLSYPYDIRIDPQGFQFVCEFGNSRIQVFDPADQPVEAIGGMGSEPGQFHNPWGLAFDSAGNLYVADSQNHRVQKLIRRQPLAAGPEKVKRFAS
jgi:ABC-type Fe3+ transport system permease subunit/sugar lactone lactonase YvrE